MTSKFRDPTISQGGKYSFTGKTSGQDISNNRISIPQDAQEKLSEIKVLLKKAEELKETRTEYLFSFEIECHTVTVGSNECTKNAIKLMEELSCCNNPIILFALCDLQAELQPSLEEHNSEANRFRPFFLDGSDIQIIKKSRAIQKSVVNRILELFRQQLGISEPPSSLSSQQPNPEGKV